MLWCYRGYRTLTDDYLLELLLTFTIITTFLHFARYFRRQSVRLGWNWVRLYLKNAAADLPGFA